MMLRFLLCVIALMLLSCGIVAYCWLRELRVLSASVDPDTPRP